MLDHEDLKWVTASVTELNRRLQRVSRYSAQAQQLQTVEPLRQLNAEVELAAKTSQALFDRVTERLLTGGKRGELRASEPPTFTIVPPAVVPVKTAAPSVDALESSEIVVLPKHENAAAVRNPAGERELILVVDDEPEVLERASMILEEEGYRVLLAKDGFEALRIFQDLKGRITLVLLDFFLPVMDGEAIFDELKLIDPNVQVVLSSGFREQTKLGGMLARGLCGFIPKPYTSEKLLDQVRLIIAA